MKTADIKTDKKGKPKPDKEKRDSERVPLEPKQWMNIIKREVQPHLPDSWIDRSRDKIGYEINFTKYFYKFMSTEATRRNHSGSKIS